MAKAKKLEVKEEVKPVEIVEPTAEEKKIHIPKSRKELAKDKLKKFIDEESKTVKGRFRCYETPGASSTITVKKYPDMPVFSKAMQDGEVYEIPLYVARFLNGTDVTADAVGGKIHTCSYPVHGFKWNEGSPTPPPCTADSRGTIVPISGIVSRTRRYGFESMEFGG